jgi:hypothetical protein
MPCVSAAPRKAVQVSSDTATRASCRPSGTLQGYT